VPDTEGEGSVRISGALAVLSLGAAIALTSGCTGGRTATGPAGSNASASASGAAAQAQAVDQLAAAVRGLTTDAYRYTVQAGDTNGNGFLDPDQNTASLSVGIAAEGEPYKVDALVLDKDYYVKLSGFPVAGVNSTRWFHVAGAKIKSLAAVGIKDINDPTGASNLTTSVASVRKSGDRSFTGTLDLTKGSNGIGLDDVAVAQLGDKVTSVPFEATVNNEGRLERWKMTIPASGASEAISYEVGYSDFGRVPTLSRPPASEVAEAPEAVYQMLRA
jgi:hypothetical protein